MLGSNVNFEQLKAETEQCRYLLRSLWYMKLGINKNNICSPTLNTVTVTVADTFLDSSPSHPSFNSAGTSSEMRFPRVLLSNDPNIFTNIPSYDCASELLEFDCYVDWVKRASYAIQTSASKDNYKSLIEEAKEYFAFVSFCASELNEPVQDITYSTSSGACIPVDPLTLSIYWALLERVRTL